MRITINFESVSINPYRTSCSDLGNPKEKDIFAFDSRRMKSAVVEVVLASTVNKPIPARIKHIIFKITY